MNIKITYNQFMLLTEEKYITIEYGSTSGEDKDFLHIIPTNSQMDGCIHNRNHFLFYKDEKNKHDNLFATPRMIFNSLVTGSNDLCYKLLKEGLLSNIKVFSEISVESFNHYKNAKMLLGIAERDLKQSQRHKDPLKKIKWSNIYYKWVCDMVEKESLPYNENITIDKIRELRVLCKTRLKSTVELPIVNKISYDIYTEDFKNIPSLGFVPEIYFKNWRDSL